MVPAADAPILVPEGPYIISSARLFDLHEQSFPHLGLLTTKSIVNDPTHQRQLQHGT